MEKVRVLVADDHPVFREGLCRLLSDQEDLEIVGKTVDGEETVRLAKELVPDVIILDVAMPNLNGIEAAKQIKQACPSIAILIVSAYSYESYVLASLRAGAAGYLLKNAPLRDLVGAIRAVHAGEAVFDLKAASQLLTRLAAEKGQETTGTIDLQPREMEVLKLAAKGMSNRQIAHDLVVSERTVQTHLANIFRKMGVSSRTEAVIHALKEGWISIDNLP